MRYNGLTWQPDTRQPLLKRPGRRRLNRERFEQVVTVGLILAGWLYIVMRLP